MDIGIHCQFSSIQSTEEKRVVKSGRTTGGVSGVHKDGAEKTIPRQNQIPGNTLGNKILQGNKLANVSRIIF